MGFETHARATGEGRWRSSQRAWTGSEQHARSGVILGSDASFTERNPVDADAADLGGATGVPAASAVRSRKESTRDAE